MKIIQNKSLIYKKISKVLVVSLLLILAFSPLVSSEQNLKSNNSKPIGDTKELDLLKAEHYFYFTATENVSEFNIRYAFPPDYSYQVPILVEILDDTTADILNYKIEEDDNEPNLVVNYTIGGMQKDETSHIHFYYYVLVKNFEYEDYPRRVKFPKKSELPDDTKIWLTPTDVVQSKSLIINLKSKQIKGINNNLVRYASRVAKFSRIHRYGLFLFQLYTGTFGPQDAISTLFRNGECPGRSHLGAALLRVQGVPSRILIANPTYDFWYQGHFMNEFYLPDYGWILTEVHEAIIPQQPNEQIILRICYPEDEQNTHSDYFFDRMTSIEHWFWIENENIEPVYIDLKEGSKANMFIESQINFDSYIADNAFFITKQILYYYKMYVGEELIGEDLIHFENAIDFQFDAIGKLKRQKPDEYIFLMDMALDEYKEIEL